MIMKRSVLNKILLFFCVAGIIVSVVMASNAFAKRAKDRKFYIKHTYAWDHYLYDGESYAWEDDSCDLCHKYVDWKNDYDMSEGAPDRYAQDLFVPRINASIIVAVVVLAVAALIKLTLGCHEVMITNYTIYGKTFFGRQVEISKDSVTGFRINPSWNSLTISTASGTFYFPLIENADQAFSQLEADLPNLSHASQQPSDINILRHILLLVFTGGIWMFIWIYRTTQYLNSVDNKEHRDPFKNLLFCIFVPFYTVYWTYKSAQQVDKLSAASGVPSNLSTVCLVLAVFVGIIPPILIQDKLNSLVVRTECEHAAPSPATTVQNNIEELRSYKMLLDEGIITQEEFDAKKKQLLGL